jgi:ATP/maltotriose-dependent transcriptional regulator MalT
MELFTRIGLAMLAVCRKDSAGAQDQYAALESWRGTVVPFAMTFVDRVLGLLALTMDRLDQAGSHFEDSMAFCRKAGFRPELAWTGHDYADALLVGAQGNALLPDDRAKAMSLLDESLAISTELGMPPLMKKVTALQESLGVQPARTREYPSNLTERQWEVLQLLAQGKTNREIAQTLVLSDRTVQRHIADIYDKIGARNRSEATAFVMSQSDLPK